jgi:hypothetical protein
MPPGPARKAALEALREDLKRRAGGLDAAAEELRCLVLEHDPVELIPSIAVPSSMGHFDAEAPDDAPLAYSWDAKVEYLVGLALSGPPGTAPVPPAVTQRAVRLVTSVFDAAQARLFLNATSESPTERDGVDGASYLLRIERLADRMNGYATHLEEIDDAVFEPHRDRYVRELGFCPSDAVRLVRRHVRWVNREFNEAAAALAEAVDGWEADHEVGDGDAAVQLARRFQSAMEAPYLWTAELLAETTSLPVSELAALLDHMSNDFECQSEFRLPFDDNRAMLRPLVRLPDQCYLAPLPWSVAHGVHDWIEDHLKHTSSGLASVYRKHRSTAAEALVYDALSTIFGSAAHPHQHYDSADGHGEIDCLVEGGVPVLVEVKSQSLTELGRRGHRPRLERVADDVVCKSFEQVERSASYLRCDGRTFSDFQGGKAIRRLPDKIEDPLSIVVTFERMDPVALSAPELAGPSGRRQVWVTNLADFLMVRDVLPSPPEFMHYAKSRSRATEVGVQVYVESDALGGYLLDRLSPLIDDAVGEGGADVMVALGYSSGSINEFFTMTEMGLDAECPGTGVPQAVIDALRSTEANFSTDWWTLACAVMTVHRDDWRRWRRFVRRHKGERPFALPSSSAALVVSASIEKPEIREGAEIVLAIPRTSAA